MRKTLLRRSTVGALLLAWWQAKTAQAEPRLTWLDAATLVALVALGLAERHQARRK